MSSQVAEIPRIQKLDGAVVNRIAAGEVIQVRGAAVAVLSQGCVELR